MAYVGVEAIFHFNTFARERVLGKPVSKVTNSKLERGADSGQERQDDHYVVNQEPHSQQREKEPGQLNCIE